MAKNKRKKPKNRNNQAPISSSEKRPRKEPVDVNGSFTQVVQPNSPIIFWALLFLIASTAIVGPYGQKYGYTPDLHMSAYIQVFGFGILALLMFSWFKRRTILLPRMTMIALPTILLFAWIGLSILWVHNTYEYVVDLLYWCGALACGALVLLLVTDIKAVRMLLFAILISGLLIALLGIGQLLFGIDWVQQHIVPAATFSNKNMAGQYGLLTMPLALVFFMESKESLKIWFYAITSALIIVFMFYTRSRGVWISGIVTLVAFIGVFLYWRYVQGYKLFFSIEKIAAVFISLALIFTLANFTPKTFGFEEEVTKASIGAKGQSAYTQESGAKILKEVVNQSKHTADIRFTIWINSIPMFIDHFFLGVGFGNWIVHYPKYQAWLKQDKKLLQNQFHANAHNDYVEFICEFGFIGTMLLLWLFVNLLRVIGRVLSKKSEDTFSMLSLAPVLAILGIGVDAVFSFPLKQPVPIMLVFVYIALLGSMHCIRQGDAGWKLLTIPTKLYQQVAALVFTAVTAVLTALHYQWYQSEIDYRKAVTSLSSQETGAAKRTLAAARSAYERNPLRKRLLWLQGTALLKLGNVKGGVTKLEETLAAYPNSDNTVHNLVSAYSHTGRFDEALQLLNEMRVVQPYKLHSYNRTLARTYTTFFLKQGLYMNAKEIIELQLATAQNAERNYRKQLKNTEARHKAEGKPPPKGLIRKYKSIQANVRQYESQIKAIDQKLAERKAKHAKPVVIKDPGSTSSGIRRTLIGPIPN